MTFGVEPGPAVADLAERYYREYVAVHSKPGTAKLHHRVVRKHILPEFGELAVTAVGREHVTDLHYRLRHVSAVANQVIVTLSRMINQAEVWGLAPEGGNPCRFVVKYCERKRERFLTKMSSVGWARCWVRWRPGVRHQNIWDILACFLTEALAHPG